MFLQFISMNDTTPHSRNSAHIAHTIRPNHLCIYSPLPHRHTLDIARALINYNVSVADSVSHVQVVECDCIGLISADGQVKNLSGSLVDKMVEQHSKISFSVIGGAVVVFTTAPLVYSTSKSLSKYVSFGS